MYSRLGLHAWLLIQSKLPTLLTHLIVRRLVGTQTKWRYHPIPNIMVTEAVETDTHSRSSKIRPIMV